MTIHHQHISTTHKANITRALQGALQTLFVPDPRERAENFSENVADHATNLSGDGASAFKRVARSFGFSLSFVPPNKHRAPSGAMDWLCYVGKALLLVAGSIMRPMALCRDC